jgi:hypothetical protein
LLVLLRSSHVVGVLVDCRYAGKKQRGDPLVGGRYRRPLGRRPMISPLVEQAAGREDTASSRDATPVGTEHEEHAPAAGNVH